ncbi:MAG: effector-associated domain EAD1-containing protein, partial [Cyanobacteriota bacterium]|nr:effector-associated domain EAD1-containing protein [Cyanobacteriota bacterium]
MSSEIKKLSGKERGKLREAIMSGYPKISKLKIMLSDELDRKLDKIVGGSDLEEVVFNLIETAESQGWLPNLIRAASEVNPGNTDLQSIKKELGFDSLSDNIGIDKNCSAIREKWNELFKYLENIKHLRLMSKICRDSIQNINKDIDFVANYPELEYIDN